LCYNFHQSFQCEENRKYRLCDTKNVVAYGSLWICVLTFKTVIDDTKDYRIDSDKKENEVALMFPLNEANEPLPELIRQWYAVE
jgi:hypothetical protein